MTDRSSTPGCDEAAVRLARFILMSHQSGDRYESDAMLTIAKALIARSEIASSVTPSAVPTREWITCPATGQTCHEYCDPGQGDVCAKDGGPTPMFAPSAGVQSATGPILPWTPKEARRLLDFQHAHCTDDHEEAYHQIYWLVTDRAADPFHPWAEVEEAAKLAPADRKETDD